VATADPLLGSDPVGRPTFAAARPAVEAIGGGVEVEGGCGAGRRRFRRRAEGAGGLEGSGLRFAESQAATLGQSYDVQLVAPPRPFASRAPVSAASAGCGETATAGGAAGAPRWHGGFGPSGRRGRGE